MSVFPDPVNQPPPWIHTITSRGAALSPLLGIYIKEIALINPTCRVSIPEQNFAGDEERNIL
jgi:hypothetical protein